MERFTVSDEGLTAAVLVGGHSRRMGTNKALLTFGTDGTTVVESLVHKLSQVADKIVLVGMDPAAYAFLDLPWIDDLVPGSGPLGGIYSALMETGSPRVLVTACDMPFLNVRLLQYMAALPRDYDVLVPVLEQTQPLHAIYARSCLPLIDQSLQSGRYTVTGWFGNANVRTMERSILERYDSSLRSCFNMNTREDVEWANQVRAHTSDAPALKPAPSG
jgi:molybdopterin-guanine dinucleotide biosynthesis protein A